MGYKIAICPGLLLGGLVLLGDAVLSELARTRQHPAGGSSGPREFFQRFGSDGWDAIRDRFAVTEATA